MGQTELPNNQEVQLLIHILGMDILFAILIFVVGMYSGVKFWPSTQSSTDINSTQSVQTFENYSPPQEDYFPVAGFKKQAAILLGCHNQINLIQKLWRNCKGIDKIALLGVSMKFRQKWNTVIKNLGLESIMRF